MHKTVEAQTPSGHVVRVARSHATQSPLLLLFMNTIVSVVVSPPLRWIFMLCCVDSFCSSVCERVICSCFSDSGVEDINAQECLQVCKRWHVTPATVQDRALGSAGAARGALIADFRRKCGSPASRPRRGARGRRPPLITGR